MDSDDWWLLCIWFHGPNLSLNEDVSCHESLKFKGPFSLTDQCRCSQGQNEQDPGKDVSYDLSVHSQLAKTRLCPEGGGRMHVAVYQTHRH